MANPHPVNAGKGRPKGSRNKVTRELREAALVHSADALQTLVDLMKDDEQPGAVRKGAADSILDRAHGKPSQAVQHSGGIAVGSLTKEQRDAAVAAALAADS